MSEDRLGMYLSNGGHDADPGVDRSVRGPGRRGRKSRGRSIDEEELERVLISIQCMDDTPESGQAILCAAHFGPLLSSQIAAVSAGMLFDAEGQLVDHLTVTSPGKYGARTRVWLQPKFREALEVLFSAYPHAERIAFRRRPNGELQYMTAEGVTSWLRYAYLNAGLQGCTSRSGWRSHFMFGDSGLA